MSLQVSGLMMQPLLVVICVFVVVVLGGLYLGYRLWSGARRQAEENLREHVARHETHVSQLGSDHEALVQQLSSKHTAALNSVEELSRACEEELEHRIELFQARHVGFIGQTEIESRADILKACRNFRYDGVLLSNLRFIYHEPNCSKIYVQIDHLLIGESGLRIVESKKWHGLTISDGVPAELGPAEQKFLRNAVKGFDDLDWKRYSLNLNVTRAATQENQRTWNDGQIRIQVRNSPANQATNQAVRLKFFLSSHGVDVGFIDRIVYYSGACDRSTVLFDPSVSDKGVSVADFESLSVALKRNNNSWQRQIDVNDVLRSLQGLFGDAVGLGRFESEYPDLMDRHQASNPNGT